MEDPKKIWPKRDHNDIVRAHMMRSEGREDSLAYGKSVNRHKKHNKEKSLEKAEKTGISSMDSKYRRDALYQAKKKVHKL